MANACGAISLSAKQVLPHEEPGPTPLILSKIRGNDLANREQYPPAWIYPVFGWIAGFGGFSMIYGSLLLQIPADKQPGK